MLVERDNMEIKAGDVWKIRGSGTVRIMIIDGIVKWNKIKYPIQVQQVSGYEKGSNYCVTEYGAEIHGENNDRDLVKLMSREDNTNKNKELLEALKKIAAGCFPKEELERLGLAGAHVATAIEAIKEYERKSNGNRSKDTCGNKST